MSAWEPPFLAADPIQHRSDQHTSGAKAEGVLGSAYRATSAGAAGMEESRAGL